MRRLWTRFWAQYHKLVPAVTPDGVVPWPTPILTFLVWVPPLYALGFGVTAITAAPMSDDYAWPSLVGIGCVIAWPARSWTMAYSAGFLAISVVICATSPIRDLPLTMFARGLLAPLLACYALAAVTH